MTPTVFTINLAFTFSLMGSLTFRSHLMSTILCLEGMMLYLLVLATLTPLNTQLMFMYPITIVIWALAAWKADMVLRLLTKISNAHGRFCTKPKPNTMQKITFPSFMLMPRTFKWRKCGPM